MSKYYFKSPGLYSKEQTKVPKKEKVDKKLHGQTAEIIETHFLLTEDGFYITNEVLENITY